jgi:hypothetical protein
LIVDHGPTAGALVVHRRNLRFFATPPYCSRSSALKTMIFASCPPSYHGVDLRVELFDGQRDRIHFLNELRTNAAGDSGAPRPGREDSKRLARDGRERGFDCPEHFQTLLGLPGLVTLVVAKQNSVRCRVDDHELDGGGADVEAHEETVRVLGCATKRRCSARARYRLRPI